ncbi:hypothetical protein AGMMS49965_17070 [Bacteroidia bacterium]|nr:hypothetical protein AGMMS49965_17070 [Bacteroidia bacterium]
MPTDSLRLPVDSIGKLHTDSLLTDSLRTNALLADSLRTDSLHLPTDSLGVVRADSVKKPPSSAIEAPVQYTAKDSTVMIMKSGNRIYMYGDAEVHYTNLELKAEHIVVDADSSILTATSGRDSLGAEFGYPAFKEGGELYEFRKARYNFKTKRLASTDIITTQNDGYITAQRAKKMENNEMFMQGGRFTTCDDHENPHYYFNMTKAMVEPGKQVAFGFTYLVMEDVPLPVAVPFGFFPFSTENSSSGLIMPTYGDEMKRGFALRDGGWYFAISDYVDLALTGEAYTRGSWGVNAKSNYRKRYKFSGNFQASYLVTITGEKEDIDYSKATDMRLTWSHSQDPKANPFGTFSASVNISTSSFNRNNLTGLSNGDYTQNTKSSTVNYTYRPPNSPFSFSVNASGNQISRDTTLSVTLPNLTVNMRDVYPFRRKEQIGEARWYENIRMSYSGTLTNGISNVKEREFFDKSLIKDWKNGARHSIPVSASFNLLKAITLTPSINYNERWTFNKVEQGYNPDLQRVVPTDTTYGFYRIYDYSVSVSANTKLYGMYKFWNGFGKWAERTQIRHVFTPSVSFSGAPDFSKDKYGYYKEVAYQNAQGNTQTTRYSPYAQSQYGVPGSGSSGSMSFTVDNNLEMKMPIADTDSLRKITLIDNFNFGLSYNFLADSLNWSDLRASLRLKVFGQTFTLQGTFDMYEYGATGQKINQLRMANGKLPRFQGTSAGHSVTLNNATFTKLSEWLRSKSSKSSKKNDDDGGADGTDSSGSERQSETPPPASSSSASSSSRGGSGSAGEGLDAAGYYQNSVPWSLSFNYSLNMSQDRTFASFNQDTREYPYKFTHSLGVSGNITPTKNWSVNMSTSYDFDAKKFATLNCNITRKMHCWNMTASFIPIGPYQYYSFTIAITSAILKDIKYSQSSNYRDAGVWGSAAEK